MSIARANFLNRLAILRKSLIEPAISDGAPTDVDKNAVAGILRSGLAVLSFAITEDFIRDRTTEALQGFANPNIGFSDLSESLQQAVTISAMKGVLFRSEMQDKANRLSWVLSELIPIANAQKSIAKLSPYSFGHARSNLSHTDLTDILSAFGIDCGWQSITRAAKRIGLGGVLDNSQAFQNVAKRRHRAAHSLTAQIPLNDLSDSVNAILGIGSGFDILLSHALSLHNAGTPPTKASGMVTDSSLTLRFISSHPTQPGKFREQTEVATTNALHTFRVHSTLAESLAEAGARAKSQKEQLIVLGTGGIPDQWVTW